MLAGFAAFTPGASIAAEPSVAASSSPQENDSLPDLGTPARPGSATVLPGPNGITAQGRFDGTKIVVAPEYSNQTGASLGLALASMLGDHAAVGVLLTAGADKKELLLNAGFKLDERQRFIVSAGQLKQFLDYAFVSGNEKAGMTQNSGGISYQFQLGKEFLRYLEMNGYVSKTASRDLADKTFAVDTATLYELWNDPRRIAGGKVGGLQGKLGFSPISGSTVKVSFGYEHLSYDLLAGSDSVNRPTAGLEWQQQIGNGYQLKIGAESFAAQNRYSVGVDRSLVDGGGRHNIGLNLIGLRGRDGLGDDQQLQLSYSYVFGGGAVGNPGRAFPAGSGLPGRPTPSHAAQSPDAPPSAASFGGNLLDQVAQRPSFIPGQVLAKVDTTALPTRLIAIDKTALPVAATINTATGDVTVPLGVAVTGIAGVTRNLAAFANGSQFALAGGNSLIIRPSQIVQPAVGIVDTYVVTINNLGGGTTLVTVQISHGSVKVDSIVVTAGASADTAAPTTTGAPAVSATTYSGTTLSATINEAGTGYYLVQAAAAAAPSVAAVQAGTSFAMTANTAASVAISGLSASTAYKVYFVAKDAANNVQTAVQNVAVTTIATPDTTAPSTTSAPAVSGTTDTGTTLSATINEAGTGYYLVQPAAAAAPSVVAVQAGTSFAMTANVAATQTISGLTASTAYKVYFVAKDAANNIQAAVQNVAVTTIAPPDTTAPTTTAAPAVSGTTDTGTTLSVSINEAGTGYYLVQPAAAAAPSVAAIQAGTSFAMTANVAATQTISGLTASTAYKVYFVAKDAANNVQAAVQNVAVTTIATPDTTAPTTTAAPAVSGTTDIGTTLSVSINEAGTGYYLVQPAAAAAPSVAAVQAGTSFAMTANVAATQTISGLTASTAYKVYFVANDAANNVQAAVQNVAVTTIATPDTTAPSTTSAPAVSGTTDTGTTLSATINEAGTGYYLVQPAAAAAPSVAAVQAGTAFAMTANTPASVAISGLTASTAYKVYFVAKDGANNVQAAVQNVAVTTTAAPDLTAPTTTAAPSVSGTTLTSTTLSATINETGTGYYLVQPTGAAAPSVAAVLAGTSFAMTANTPASVAISALSASTAYKVYFVAKDGANNVQAAVQSVAVLINHLPTANDFTFPTDIGNSSKTENYSVKSAANDVDGDTLTGSLYLQGTKGTASISGQNITYAPSAGQSGSDTMVIRISDGNGGGKDITITVNGITP